MGSPKRSSRAMTSSWVARHTHVGTRGVGMEQDWPMEQPRIAPITPEECDERTTELLDGLGAGMSQALNIFTTLAHHPRLLKKWSEFGGILLYRGELDARLREIVILRTGWLCKSEYEFGQHRVI